MTDTRAIPFSASGGLLTCAVVLALLCALPTATQAKGKRGGGSSGKSQSSHQQADADGGKSVNINLRSNSNSSPGAPQEDQSKAATAAAVAAGLAANAIARGEEDKAKTETDYAARKAEYDKERAAKGLAPTASKPATNPLEGKENLKAAFNAINGAPPGGLGQIFKVIDANGRITFTDAPPNAANLRVYQGIGRKDLAGSSTESPFRNLPASLNQVVSRFPVVLFSGSNCAPCEQARALLNGRGVPFQERTVRTNADIEALARMSGGDATLPMTNVGGQSLRGFSDVELNANLDAAGYPAQSALPSGFRNPAATPLVTVDRSAVATAGAAPSSGSTGADGLAFNNPRGNVALSPEESAERAARAAAQREAAAAQTANPAGIRF